MQSARRVARLQNAGVHFRRLAEASRPSPGSLPRRQSRNEERGYFALPRFFAVLAIRKSSFFFPALISRASHPAVPPLPLQVSPVLGCRYFAATFVPFIDPGFLTAGPS